MSKWSDFKASSAETLKVLLSAIPGLFVGLLAVLFIITCVAFVLAFCVIVIFVLLLIFL
jgi:hypothetical protein